MDPFAVIHCERYSARLTVAACAHRHRRARELEGERRFSGNRPVAASSVLDCIDCPRGASCEADVEAAGVEVRQHHPRGRPSWGHKTKTPRQPWGHRSGEGGTR